MKADFWFNGFVIGTLFGLSLQYGGPIPIILLNPWLIPLGLALLALVLWIDLILRSMRNGE